MGIRLEYETRAEDQLAKLERYAAGFAGGRRFLWAVYLGISGLAWLSAALFYVKQGDRSLGYLGYAALAAGLTATLPRLYRWYQRSFWASVLTADALHGLVGPTVVTVDDDGIEEVGPVLSARRAWRQVVRVERDAERTLIFVAPLIAVVVPARAHPDAAARAAFERFVGDRVAGGGT